ncbi:MAG: ScyD/ScyE family protein [Actinobacteria bacterium]|nr:ScyD/ScyE family protein [Actinomycetota bacterium]
MRSTLLRIGVATVSVGLLFAQATTASAHGTKPRDPVVKSTAVVAPFNLEVFRGKVYVADGFANTVASLKKDGSLKTVVADAPGTSGIAHSKNGRYFAYTYTEGGPEEITASGLKILGPRGKQVVADTLAYEKAKNPDKKLTYGPKSTDACVTDALGPAYPGHVDSHAYSVVAYGSSWIVADAGANALFKVNKRGKVSTLAVLPAHPAKITAEIAAALGLPDCTIGVTYRFEAVPTDVEIGKDGYLYVTTLPGGPETPAAGARGKLYRVNPRTGATKEIARGFAGATNLAIGSNGRIYVAEYFAGKISVVSKGKVKPYLALHNVVALEAVGNTLWAGTTVNLDPTLPPVPGTIVKIVKGKASPLGKLKH